MRSWHGGACTPDRAVAGLPSRALLAPVLALATLAVSGCIERALLIESEPPGAEVVLNGLPAGSTPVRVPFLHYGLYEVELRKEGFEALSVEEPVPAPWWARFPAGLFTEFLWPGRIRDERKLYYELGEPAMPDRTGLLERASAAAGGR
jgi:hypothetical protein